MPFASSEMLPASSLRFCFLIKQGRKHGKTVAGSWAGAVMQKPLTISKFLGRTDRLTRCKVQFPRLETSHLVVDIPDDLVVFLDFVVDSLSSLIFFRLWM